MPGLKDTLALLARLRKSHPSQGPRLAPRRLKEVDDFAPNPGKLRMLLYRPPNLPPSAPLVVVLHGCTQTAEGYAEGAGWLTLADRLGFAVLAPEQIRANNPSLCFNWFQPNAVKRGHGEVASIRNMVGRALATHDLDPDRVFVTGLSAGGAMTAALLAAYPEVFAAGAVVAGLPAGAAANLQEALAAMGGGGPAADAGAWGGKVRRASNHQGPWPRVAIWHGDADATVGYANAEALAAQWTHVHDTTDHAATTGTLAGHHRRRWTGEDGRAVVELITVRGMGHGAPLALDGPDGCGAAGPFLIEAGVSSSLEIARFFGLADGVAPASLSPAEAGPAALPPYAAEKPHHAPVFAGQRDVGAVINQALRSAGLMK